MIQQIINILFAFEKCEPILHLFSWYHLLIFFGSFVVFHYINHAQKINKHTECIAKISTIGMAILQIILYIWYLMSPIESLLLKGLPLYTCRLALWLFVCGQFFGMKKCLKLATYWGVYGGIAGLLFPTIFHYPVPHILQIATIVLHIYIFLLGSYYLFVKKIGMTLKDSHWCIIITIGLILFNAIFNSIFGTNYISTNKMPAHLINYLGLNLPDWLCLPAVIIGYVIVTYFQYWASNKTIEITENRKKRIKINKTMEAGHKY
jgi:hypothetical integral membrane protein (TIGR02206 family)